LIDYSNINIYLTGLLLGFGALFGDLVASLFKRQFNIKPGKPWPPFDQIDWILGAIIFVIIYISLSFQHIFIAIILFGLLHPIVNLTGYFLNVKKTKF
jgi:CDP-2,3-bis-(O-geranylgeranyl)-sn-glycerol synthase